MSPSRGDCAGDEGRKTWFYCYEWVWLCNHRVIFLAIYGTDEALTTFCYHFVALTSIFQVSKSVVIAQTFVILPHT